MTQGSSFFPIFGGWVVWVHLLTLIVFYPPEIEDPDDPDAIDDRPTVAFVDADEHAAFVCPDGAGQNALSGVRVTLSEPATTDLFIPVRALPPPQVNAKFAAAVRGRHYEADLDAAFVIRAGEQTGGLRIRDGLNDVTVESVAVSRPTRLKLELAKETKEVVAAPDPGGFRWVEIPPQGAAPSQLPSASIPTAFDENYLRIKEANLTEYPLAIEADGRPDKDAEVNVEIRRGLGDFAVPIANFSTVLPAGAGTVDLKLVDFFEPAELERLGLADDLLPGADEFYELHLDPRPPLIAKADPCFLTIRVLDDDEPVTLSCILENASGDEIERLDPDQPYWIVPVLSGPLESDCLVSPTRNGRPLLDDQGQPLTGVIPAGLTREPRFGPFKPEPGKVRERSGAQGQSFRPCCPDCKDHGGACKRCEGKGKCHSCGGREGGCGKCQGGKCCGQCGGRPGGCAACGFGSGKCVGCGGAGCGICQRGGGPGMGGGQGGGSGSGQGDGQGGGGGVAPESPEDTPVGDEQPGEVMLLLVNNQRLHEPADEIAPRVGEAIKGEALYRDAALVVNDTDSDDEFAVMKPGDPPPDSEQTFRPFRNKQDGLSGQVGRIVETIEFHRKTAKNPGMRAVVVWPERELASATELEPLARMAESDGGPISILCPDADPVKARQLSKALQAGGADITVRSPKSQELIYHVKDVLHAGK